MADREKVIEGLKCCFENEKCDGCPYEMECRKILFKTQENHCPILDDVLALLKEQEEEIENLKQTAQSMMEGICLLKEQNNCENCAIAIEDRQPVVRCKDCIHWIPGRIAENGDFIQPRCERNGGGWSSDEYCSNAERREQDA